VNQEESEQYANLILFTLPPGSPHSARITLCVSDLYDTIEEINVDSKAEYTA